MSVCPLNVTQNEYDSFSKCEAVIIREYERIKDGSRFAKVVAWGDYDELVEQLETPGLVVVPAGLTIICHVVKKVNELEENTDPRGS